MRARVLSWLVILARSDAASPLHAAVVEALGAGLGHIAPVIEEATSTKPASAAPKYALQRSLREMVPSEAMRPCQPPAQVLGRHQL
jgi:hypothetical protein